MNWLRARERHYKMMFVDVTTTRHAITATVTAAVVTAAVATPPFDVTMPTFDCRYLLLSRCSPRRPLRFYHGRKRGEVARRDNICAGQRVQTEPRDEGARM